MAELDWNGIQQRKDAHRDRMAALPFDQKMELLERLRVRTKAVADRSTAFSVGARASASTVQVSFGQHPVREAGMNTVGAINLGVFGMSATLIAAMRPAPSSPAAATLASRARAR
jgi:hypothetical protein